MTQTLVAPVVSCCCPSTGLVLTVFTVGSIIVGQAVTIAGFGSEGSAVETLHTVTRCCQKRKDSRTDDLNLVKHKYTFINNTCTAFDIPW